MALPALIFLVFALLPLFAWLTAQQYLLDLAARIMVFAVAAVALDLLVGYGGLISFGHAGFIGLGAYAVGILSAEGIGDALIALPAAIAVAMLFAWLTGIVCLRTKGVYFIMITLAFGQMIYFIATSLAPYGGDNGLTIAARNTVAGWPLIKSDPAFYYFTLLCLLATYLFCRTLIVSRFGRVLRGAKENATRMATIGFTARRFQLVAYVIAGGLGGLSGFLLANLTEFVSPEYMSWQQSGELIVMVILGGVGTLDGAIIGSAVLSPRRRLAVGDHRELAGDFRAAACACRSVRPRRSDRSRLAVLAVRSWLNRCFTLKACARTSAVWS